MKDKVPTHISSRTPLSSIVNQSMTMEDELPPDALEKKVRIGCGAVAGIVIGLLFGSAGLSLIAGWLWGFAGIVAMVVALLALRYGDRFWLGLLKSLGELPYL